jgi:hypothetical protein
MDHADGTALPFDENNRAWRRFSAAITEGIDVITWQTVDQDRPVMLSIVDQGSGDAVTLAVIDSVEVRDPHVVITVSREGGLAVHGPVDGPQAAAAHGPNLARTDLTIAATKPAPLHGRDAGATPLWEPVPAHLAGILHPEPVEHAAAVVLLDRTTNTLIVVGPFVDDHTAAAWNTAAHGSGHDTLIVPLHHLVAAP